MHSIPYKFQATRRYLMEPIIFHVDVNSAYLSWSAVWELKNGIDRDIRNIPSVVAGNPESRRGVVLAKSQPAKKYGIITGESLFTAFAKYPDLVVVPARFKEYSKASDHMAKILSKYSSVLERYSIDECFLDMGTLKRTEALKKAHKIRQEIFDSLGFTVNVGIGANKLTAKMASDFQKPNQVHSLFPDEIKTKFHPLPIEELFMVGPALAKKLRNINISTIGDLASFDPEFLYNQFGKMGLTIWRYAKGMDDTPVHPEGSQETKGMGHSTTVAEDLTKREDCHQTIQSLLSTLVERLQSAHLHTTCVAVHYTTSTFKTRRRQRMLSQQTDSYDLLYQVSRQLFDDIWEDQPLRKIGISFTQLRSNKIVQLSMMNLEEHQKQDRLENTLIKIRNRFGEDALIRGNSITKDFKTFDHDYDDDETDLSF